MDGLTTILSVIASILAVVGGALPLVAHWEERKKAKSGNNLSSQTGSAIRSEPEA